MESLITEPGLTLPLPGAEPPAARAAASRSQVWRAVWELLHDLSVATLFCFFLITFVAQAFRVQGTSMLPLLHDGERIVVNKLAYRLSPIRRGDVVVFHYPLDPSVSFIKRVVGLPGEVVELRRGVLYLDGQRVAEEYIRAGFRDDESHPPRRVLQGHYYVLGDHRNSSNDSRTWGDVPAKYIYGQAFFRFWPLSGLGLVE